MTKKWLPFASFSVAPGLTNDEMIEQIDKMIDILRQTRDHYAHTTPMALLEREDSGQP